MSSQVIALKTVISAAVQKEAELRGLLKVKEARVEALSLVLEQARAELSEANEELRTLHKSIVFTKGLLEAEERAPQTEGKPAVNPPSAPRVWHVSDCHSHCSTGAWALEATESGSYGVCVSPAEADKDNISVPLVTGGSAPVSKKRYSPKKGVTVTDISVGDILFMGDKKRNMVFKGTVKSQAVKGFFRSADPSVNSFRRRVGEREARGNSSFRSLADEVEMMWEVEWTPVAALTEEWKKYIRFSDRPTFLPLEGAPPA
jgi:hypothetical protein